MPDSSQSDQQTLLSQVFGWIAAVLGFAFVGWVLYMVYDAAKYHFWDRIVLEHFASIIGLPCAAVASLILVLVLRTVAGKTEFKFLGFEFKGASGPIIMWILCFLAAALAITQTWNLTFTGSVPSVQKQNR